MSRRKAERRLWAWGALLVGLTGLMAFRSLSVYESALVLLTPVFEGHAWFVSGEGRIELRISSFGDLTRIMMGDERVRIDRSVVGGPDPHPGALARLFSRGVEFSYLTLILAELLFLVVTWWIVSKRYRKTWRWLTSRSGSGRKSASTGSRTKSSSTASSSSRSTRRGRKSSATTSSSKSGSGTTRRSSRKRARSR